MLFVLLFAPSNFGSIVDLTPYQAIFKTIPPKLVKVGHPVFRAFVKWTCLNCFGVWGGVWWDFQCLWASPQDLQEKYLANAVFPLPGLNAVYNFAESGT
eukprot:2490184-Amphidinium_carterae.1